MQITLFLATNARPRPSFFNHFFTTTLLLLLFTLLTAKALPQSIQPWINVRDYGATGNGVTDDTNAITTAIAAARQTIPHAAVFIPAGTYRYSRVLRIDSLMVYGEGATRSTLLADSLERSSIILTGQSPKFFDIRIRTATNPIHRDPRSEATGIDVYQATDFNIQRVHVGPVASAGILVRRSQGTRDNPSIIRNCIVENTLADGIHMTDGSRFIDVSQNHISSTGDDFIAVVSYRSYPHPAGDIYISKNTGHSQTDGRGISVVGGTDVVIDANHISQTCGAGVYLASEAGWDTYGVRGVTVRDNTIIDVANANTGHGGIHLSGRPDVGGEDCSVNTIFITSNSLTDCGYSGLMINPYTKNVRFASNEISGTGNNGITIASNTSDIYIIADNSNPNIIRNCAEYGIYVSPRSCSGALLIADALMQNINTRRLGYVDAINIEPSSTFSWISVSNVRLEQPSGGVIERFIESASPLLSAAGNSSNRVLQSTLFMSCPLP